MSTRCSTIIVLTSLVSRTFAYSILPTSNSDGFPTCASSCATLQSAAGSCEASPSGQQAIIDSCFCQSALLTNLKSDPSSICGAACTSSSDLSALASWYSSFCSSASTEAETATTGGTTATTATAATTTVAGTSSVAASATATSSSGALSSSSNKNVQTGSWIHTHWRWILMIALLIVGFGALCWFCFWLKRRNRRREMARRGQTPLPTNNNGPSSQLSLGTSGAGTRTGTMQSYRSRTGTMQSRHRGDMREVWGPHQHMAATRGWEYTSNGVIERGADTIEEVPPAAVTSRPRTPSGNSRTPSGSRPASGSFRLQKTRPRPDMTDNTPAIQEIDANTLPTRRYDDEVGKPRGKRPSRSDSRQSAHIDEKGAATAAAAAIASQKRHQDRQNLNEKDEGGRF